MTTPRTDTPIQLIHYGSNGSAECGVSNPRLTTLAPKDVTCPTCRGWLPIVAPMTDTPEPPPVSILWERYGNCFWHYNCVEGRGNGIMRRVRKEPERTLFECLHCGQHGYYPVGGTGVECSSLVEVAHG